MRIKLLVLSLIFSFSFLLFGQEIAFAETSTDGNGLIDIKLGDEGDLTSSVKMLILVGILGIAPSIMIMFTCFTHIIIVLSMTRQGLGAGNVPPNQVLTGLALFVTIYIMSPVISDINEKAYQPYNEGVLPFTEAVKAAETPIKLFMLKNTDEADLMTFLKLRNDEKPKNPEDVSIWAAIPAYTLSQITAGLTIGLMIYGGFILIDIVIGSVLMFMGMMMLPPQLVSVPIKILLFVQIGGFSEIIRTLFDTIKT